MPLKNGRLTGMEREFAKHMARTNDQEYSAHKAGYKAPSVSGSQLVREPLVMEATREAARAFLKDKAPAVSMHVLTTIAMDEKQPAGARVTAAMGLGKLSGIAVTDGESTKDLHEMSAQELAAYHAKLVQQADAIRQAQAERAKPVLEGETAHNPPSALD